MSLNKEKITLQIKDSKLIKLYTRYFLNLILTNLLDIFYHLLYDFTMHVIYILLYLQDARCFDIFQSDFSNTKSKINNE